jgi:tetratricopeptide (TPR) repeat protein
MSIRSVLIVGLAIGSILFAGSSATEILLTKARSLEGRGRLDLAAQALEQVLMADPNNEEALAGLARYAKQNGKSQEADRYLQRLRNVDAKNPAITQVGQMASITPNRGRLDEAQRLAANRNPEGAMRIYREVFGSNPPPGAWTLAYYETLAATAGGWEDAVAGLENAVKTYPRAQDYQLSLGRLLTYRPKSRARGMELLEGIKNDPAFASKARLVWRQALLWEDGSPSSRASLEAYLARYPDSELQALLTKQAKTAPPPVEVARVPAGSVEEGAGYKGLNAGRLEEADQHFLAALKAAPKSASALSGRGFVRMKQGDFFEAVPFFEQALAVAPQSKSISDALATSRFWRQMKMGTKDLDEDRLDQAVDDFQQALALRPSSKEAIQGLAGAYMKRKQPEQAVPLYVRLVQLDRDNPDAWTALVIAQNQAAKPAESLNVLKQAPQPVLDKLMRNPEFLLARAFAYADSGNVSEYRRMFQQAQEAAGGKDAMSVSLRLEFAGLLLRRHYALQAADEFEEIADAHPTNLDAWQGLLSSLVQIPDTMRAFSALQRIPRETYNNALLNVDFLRSVANLHMAMRRYDLAEAFLEKAVLLDKATGKGGDVSLPLQLADIWVHDSKTANAERLLRQILDDHPENAQAWRSLVSVLQAAKRDGAALAEIQRMPLSVRRALEDDAGFAPLEASLYNSVGRYDEAQRLIRNAILRLETERRPVPADLNIQLAWVLMNTNGKQRELYTLLVRNSTARDLTPEQRAAFDQIWSTWCLRRAQAAADDGDFSKSASILQAGLQLLPNDSRLQATLAGRLTQSGEYTQAFNIYRRWNLRGANADDYTGAIGAAMAVHQTETAESWIKRGLQLYPQDANLVSLAGKQAASVGDYKRAEAYFRRALALAPLQANAGLSSRSHSSSDRDPASGIAERARALGSLLLGDSSGLADTERATPRINPISYQRIDSQDPGMDSAPSSRSSGPLRALDPGPIPETMRQPAPLPYSSPAQTDLSGPPDGPNDTSRMDNSEFDPLSSDARALPPLPDPIDPAQKKPGADQASLSLHEEIQQNIEAIESRNTPYFQSGGSLQGRTGQGGFDKLLIEQADLQASTTIGDQVRLSLVVRPTYLDAGAADGSSTLTFGQQIVEGPTSGVQTAFGLGVEGQLATRTFGLHGGINGQGFLVENWVGGFRFNPGNGPITLMFNRDSVRDTMLSFAGQRDPVSNQVWGGVVANTASILGNWGNATSGFYLNGGYQFIRGQNVAQNSRVDATLGAYFRVINRKEGSLTIGMNLSGMHYDKNLRYFTFGQGGYFSPQRYFLFNVPVRWTGTWRQVLQYSISGSLGAQYFSENASPYFPTLSPSAILKLINGAPQPYYAAFGNTGSNFSLSARATYQLTPHWQAGAFFDANNARDYTASAAGLYLKYLFVPRPMAADLNIQSIPDWRGIQPFALPPLN